MYHNKLNPSQKVKSNYQDGFTLVELLVAISIIAILTVLAVPMFNNVFASIEANLVKQTVISTLRTSKLHSFAYRKNVILCLADENMVCHRNASHQLLAFFDLNNNRVFDINDDKILTQHLWKLKHGRVHLGLGPRRHYVKFSAETGQTRGYMGHIKYCPDNNTSTHRFQVSFSMVGNIRIKPDDIHPTGCP